MGKLSFKVGTKEVHLVEYSQSKLTGKTEIKVDGVTILSKHVLWRDDGSILKFKVGAKEIHEVEITKKMPLLFPALRTSTYSVIVDGKLSETFKL